MDRRGKQAFSESAVTMSVSNNELGELLIDLGLISPEQLSDAIVQQQNSGTRLTVVLSEMGLITERQLKDALELQYGVNFVNLSSAPPEVEYIKLVPEDVERKFRFVPVSMQGNQFTVAMVDPDDLVAAEAIRQHLSSTNFKKLVCTADDFEHLMYVTYEAPPEQEPISADETPVSVEEDDDFAGVSPRASQTKLKAHMRNLFESDSDDDLDSMFGRSSDSLPALKESDFEQPTADAAKAPPKKTKKAISKKITSLFDDDDDDFENVDVEPPAAEGGEGGFSQEAPTESPELQFGDEDLSQETSIQPRTEDEFANEQLRARPELTADIATDHAPAQEETMPSNQLLEHILQEAGVPKSKPKKMKPKKKSMQSLFDDDDDDMDFDNAEPAAEATESVETRIDSFENQYGSPETTSSDQENSTGDSLPADSLTSESLVSENYTGGSLTGDDAYAGGSLTGLQPVNEDASSFGGENLSEPEPAEPKPRKSAVSKAFKSLFDDEMDEDDLFGSDSEGVAREQETQPEIQSAEMLADISAPDVVADQADEQESAESLMTAIERPFQSLFDDDEDDDDLFGNSSSESLTSDPDAEEADLQANQFSLGETLMPAQNFDAPEPVLEHKSEFNRSEIESESESESESGMDLEGHFASDIEGDAQTEIEVSTADSDVEDAGGTEAPQSDLEEALKPAYHASFDDEMDEDSLFASASHPIPEGAPHLRDLLSRFDDSDAAFDALEGSLNQNQTEDTAEFAQPAETAETIKAPEPPTADEQDAELAVSALIAALDEQVPDENISIPPRHVPAAENEVAEPSEISSPEFGDSENQKHGGVELTEPETLVAQPESFDEPPSQYEGMEHVASLPEVSQEVPAITPPEKKSVANPKSKKLRAMMMDDDDVDFGMSTREDHAVTASGAHEPVTEERAAFQEVLPFDQEDLMPRSNATTELPPVVVSRSAKTMTQGTSIPEPTPAPAVSSFDEDVASTSQTPARTPSLEETLPPSSRPAEPITKPVLEVDTSIPMPATAAELPDALDDVLSSVTNELIDNVELANLSGNRTEISFLEEIVESELALDDQGDAKQDEPSVQPEQLRAPVTQQTATPQQAPATQLSQNVQPAQKPTQSPATQTPTAAPLTPPAVQAPPAAQAVPAAQAPAAPVAQAAPPQATPPTAPPPASNDLSVSQAAVEKLNLDPSILNLATQILTQAVNSPCSDVHFEPLADGLALRFMSDGDLLDETILPAQIQGMLILCLKSMAGLDPAVVDRPQDKRFITRSFGDPVEMRITSIPGMHGEMVAVSLKT